MHLSSQVAMTHDMKSNLFGNPNQKIGNGGKKPITIRFTAVQREEG